MVTIRPYRESDLPLIMDLGNRAWEGIYDFYRQCYGQELALLMRPSPSTSKGEAIRRQAMRHPEWILIAEEDGKLIGFLVYELDEAHKIGQIDNNAVELTHRGKGVGQQLYQVVFERFRAAGMKYARVSTGMDEAHGPARRAYERAGFDIHNEMIHFYKKL
jgi:ribosomal protein S18 acetylase RimI-like enzyme